MGAMIGPITLTVGQPYKVSLAQDTAYIELQNDSLYDVWVFFGEIAPTDLTNANGSWHRVVRRQHNGVLPVENNRGASAAERRNNTIGAFRGTVWLLAVNPGGLALTGTISGRSQVYLTPYAVGDGLPAHSSLSTQTDLTSQPRIVAVPMDAPIDSLNVGSATFTAAGQDKQVNTLGLSASNIANGLRVPVHLFSCVLSLQNQPAATSGIDLWLEFMEYASNGVTIIQDIPFLKVFLAAPAFNATPSSQVFVFAPPAPIGNVIAANGPTSLIGMRLLCNAIQGATVTVNYNVFWATDPTNASIPGSYGAAGLYLYGPGQQVIY